MILFDTDVCLSLLTGNKRILQKFGGIMEEVCVPSSCVPELYFAAEQSGNPEENRRVVEKFLATVRVVQPNADTCRYMARLQKKLIQSGITVPQTDLLVYCLSKVFTARLVTLHAGRYCFT